MEIEITDKKNNPMFKRTEVQFRINHENQGTPNQSIIRNELAESLNAKKDQIIIDSIQSYYGVQLTKGYAKVYSSRKEADAIERKHILKRNQVSPGKSKKKEETESEPPKEEASSDTESKPEPEKKTEETKEET